MEENNLMVKIRMRLLMLVVCLTMLVIMWSCLGQTKDINKQTRRSNGWVASWITPSDTTSQVNTWSAFHKTFNVENESKSTTLRLAVDTKYWLWVNGRLVIREGGLKRGPTPEDTYYDEVLLDDVLEIGENNIAVLVWYFGKDGFAHKSSGQAGLIAELYQGDELTLKTDSSWKAVRHSAYLSKSENPQPNYRLAESNIVFDAQQDLTNWTKRDFRAAGWPRAKSVCSGECSPWNKLVKRPVPFWKDYGLISYENQPTFPLTSNGDTIKCRLPYNAQVTPYFKIKAPAEIKIVMLTDNYRGGSAYNMRAEYITKDSEQEFESPGWINGHEVYYIIPEGVEVLDLKYRETGYNTEFSGNFSCNDSFYNQLWKKARRTLYVTMRDNYMDCPDRERAQWWGDVVLESGEAFYALDRQADALMKKGMLELMNWQRADSTIFSPVPAGNWDKELPGQMLASVGYYGFYNYYLHTGDIETIREIYEPVKRYLAIWKLNDHGTLELRSGGWTWGDWGKNKDVPLLMNTQYYMALKSLKLMSEALGENGEAEEIAVLMQLFKKNFNESFWKGDHYRSATYDGAIDDRSQGLAVVSGLSSEDKYEAIYEVLKVEQHGSPYMEKYVLEALFQMGYEDLAFSRMKERFTAMVRHPTITSLWEGWGIGNEGYGGGTINHAWSGGGLTLLSQYAAGISPLEPGYEQIQIKPQPGPLNQIDATVNSVKGDIKVYLKIEERYKLELKIPTGTLAQVYLPTQYSNFNLNNAKLIVDGQYQEIDNVELISSDSKFIVLIIPGGVYEFLGSD